MPRKVLSFLIALATRRSGLSGQGQRAMYELYALHVPERFARILEGLATATGGQASASDIARRLLCQVLAEGQAVAPLTQEEEDAIDQFEREAGQARGDLDDGIPF